MQISHFSFSFISEEAKIIKSKICYRKIPKNSDICKICCNHPKISTKWLYHRVMRPIGTDGMANSVDPDQEQFGLGLHCLPRSICPKT